ncbi:MAG TPA: HU family DNA-binding protein [Clostridiales bacterium]|nr:HU family DNA-binding protein [Clostridiales bacterium]
MKKSDLVAAVAEKQNLSKKDVEGVINAAIEEIKAALAKGDNVQLIGFGTFEVRERAERVGKNPRTKETITIPACKVPAFKAGKALKDAVK